MATFIPWGDEEDAARYEALHEGVPQWLRKSVCDWTVRQFAVPSPYSGVGREPNRAQVERCVLMLRGRLLLPQTGGLGDFTRAVYALTDDDLLLLADWALAHPSDPRHIAVLEEHDLERLLYEGGSAWTVGQRGDRTGLRRRVPEGVQSGLEHVATHSLTAGDLLRRAWGAAYGIEPNPTEAYRLAIRAVEAAVVPAVSPNNTRASLGTVIRDIEQQKDWRLPMLRESAPAPSGQVLLDMMRMLWHCQHDRHEGQEDELPVDVTREEAEVAVAVAIPLIQWFTARLARRDSAA